MNEYEGLRRVVYGDGAQFVPVCQQCGRFVRTPGVMQFDAKGQPKEPNATCSRCGPTTMVFEGYYDVEPVGETSG
jgi:hypothetical protein